MIQFLVALGAFLILHIVPSTSGIRDRLVARFGENTYRGIYSVLSLVLIAWVIMATLRAPRIDLWYPDAWHFTFAIHLMPWSVALLAAAMGAANPLSVALSGKAFDPNRPGIVAITRHPVLWAFGLWAVAHIPANGDVVSLILFGGMALFAFAGMARVETKKKRILGADQYARLAAVTSIVPFAAIVTCRAAFPLDPALWLRVAAGLAVYLWFLFWGHFWAIGADPLAFY